MPKMMRASACGLWIYLFWQTLKRRNWEITILYFLICDEFPIPALFCIQHQLFISNGKISSIIFICFIMNKMFWFCFPRALVCGKGTITKLWSGRGPRAPWVKSWEPLPAWLCYFRHRRKQFVSKNVLGGKKKKIEAWKQRPPVGLHLLAPWAEGKGSALQNTVSTVLHSRFASQCRSSRMSGQIGGHGIIFPCLLFLS